MNKILLLLRSPLLALFALFALLLGATPARAMQMRPCSDPTVFEGAALNLVVMPYRVDLPAGAAASAELRAASRQIAALVHLELLTAMLKYGAIGATDLQAEGGSICDVDEVFEQITRPVGAPGRLRAGQAVALVWGRLFEQQGELYVQSYLRFARQSADGPQAERIEVAIGEAVGGAIGEAPGAGLVLRAALPTQALAFAPRRISREELARVDREFRAALVLRDRPEAALPGSSIVAAPGQSFAYWVTDSRRGADGEWLYLKSMRAGPGGWIRARGDEGRDRWSLQRWLPELAFVDAVNGYLRLRGTGLTATERARIAGDIDAALADYQRAVPAELAPTVWGLGHAIRGQLAWGQGLRVEAAREFARARELLPAYAGARNLAVVTVPLDGALDRERVHQLSQGLMAALALAPRDELVRANLRELHALCLRKPEWSPWNAEQLRQRGAVMGVAAGVAAR